MVERREQRKRWPTTTSVALQLYTPNCDKLCLVRRKNTGQWGLVAGGLKRGEYPNESAFRELEEEAGLSREEIAPLGSPKVLAIPGEEKTSVGLVFCTPVLVKIPDRGIPVISEETDLLKPFSRGDLQDLLEREDEIYKPDFNIPAIRDWLKFAVEF